MSEEEATPLGKGIKVPLGRHAAFQIALMIISECERASLRGLVHPHVANRNGEALTLAAALYQAERDNFTTQSTVEQLQGRVARLHETLLAMHKFTFEERWGAKGFDDGAQRMFNRSLNALDPAGSIEDWLQERLKLERERAANLAESVRMDGSSGALISAAIRALPEE